MRGADFARLLIRATKRRARDIARANGVRHAYTGNVDDPVGSSTRCHGCGALLIGRDWYDLPNGTSTRMGVAEIAGLALPAYLSPNQAPGGVGVSP